MVVKSCNHEMGLVPVQHSDDMTARSDRAKFLTVRKEKQSKEMRTHHSVSVCASRHNDNTTHIVTQHSRERSVTTLSNSLLSKCYDAIMQPVQLLPSFRID